MPPAWLTDTAFLGGGGGVLALIRYVRVGELRRLTLTREEDAALIRADLLDYVLQEGPNQGDFVNLRKFWKRHEGLSPGDQEVILRPLLDDRTLLIMGRADAFGKVAGSLTDRVFLPTPDTVSLSERAWWKLVRGEATSWTIIAEQIDMSRTSNSNTNIGSGQLFASQTGGHSSSESNGNRVGQSGLSPEQFAQLANALRADTGRIDNAEAQALLVALAEECDQAAAAPDPDGSAARRIVKTAMSYVVLTSGAIEATSKVLAAFKGLL
ncbi:MAG: hypothetical protein QOD37_887 [Gaiellales bacterium]|nr:hypothetical protein [Gaiellales bacterium]